MANPFVVSVSHDLGTQEAKRRLTNGIARVKAEYGKFVTISQDEWQGDRLVFRVVSLGQAANGVVDIEPDRVTMSVTLPLLLSVLANKVRGLVQKEGHLLLEKK